MSYIGKDNMGIGGNTNNSGVPIGVGAGSTGRPTTGRPGATGSSGIASKGMIGGGTSMARVDDMAPFQMQQLQQLQMLQLENQSQTGGNVAGAQPGEVDNGAYDTTYSRQVLPKSLLDAQIDTTSAILALQMRSRFALKSRYSVTVSYDNNVITGTPPACTENTEFEITCDKIELSNGTSAPNYDVYLESFTTYGSEMNTSSDTTAFNITLSLNGDDIGGTQSVWLNADATVGGVIAAEKDVLIVPNENDDQDPTMEPVSAIHHTKTVPAFLGVLPSSVAVVGINRIKFIITDNTGVENAAGAIFTREAGSMFIAKLSFIAQNTGRSTEPINVIN